MDRPVSLSRGPPQPPAFNLYFDEAPRASAIADTTIF
jgi:hypothetical protein